jgi:predicted GNAT superfamily acetyltransferase
MHPAMTLRPATPGDVPALVDLNAAVVAVTSPMDAARARALLTLATFCTVAECEGRVIGFVLAMAAGDSYDNANFRWFADRLDRFVYIDRVVVADSARGLGLGTALYDDLLRQGAGCRFMAAEMDLVPANPGSLAFHKARGFVEIGTRTYDTGKIVSMQVKVID